MALASSIFESNPVSLGYGAPLLLYQAARRQRCVSTTAAGNCLCVCSARQPGLARRQLRPGSNTPPLCDGTGPQLPSSGAVAFGPMSALPLMATRQATRKNDVERAVRAALSQDSREEFEALLANWDEDRDRALRRNDARELHVLVYGWFTEGFDTLDLKEAKALLDELT